jgi:hypothetical protein
MSHFAGTCFSPSPVAFSPMCNRAATGAAVTTATLEEKNSPSRWRFRPPSSSAFRFRVQPPRAASSYSRSVLGAGVNLRIARSPCKPDTRRKACSLRQKILPHFHTHRVGLWIARDTGGEGRDRRDRGTLRLDITHVIVRRPKGAQTGRMFVSESIGNLSTAPWLRSISSC